MVISNPIKNCCLFIKHYMNATTVGRTEGSARPTGYTNKIGSKAEFFSARVLFKGVRILVERVRNIQLFKF